MSLFPIFKVNKLSDKNVTDTIYVFCGDTFSEEQNDINELFVQQPKNKLFLNVFDKNELEEIKTSKIDVVFIEESIHIDDNIGVIKLKIFEALEKKASMSEIYLFCLKTEKLNPVTIYQNLTLNDRMALTRIRLNQMLLNLYNIDGTLIEFNLLKKDKYTFDDILGLNLQEREYLIGKSLGQKFIFSNQYPFISNPFLVDNYDNLLENSRKELTTLNNNLLLETGDIFKNTIYLCLAGDVFEKSLSKDISIDYTSKIYYPFLYQDNINTIDSLNKTRDNLINSTNEKLTTEVKRGFENIDMFYNIFEFKKQTRNFSNNTRLTGINYIKLILYPPFTIKIPIDVIFKLVHANEEFPLIKYNPESRQENIYRLYTDSMTLDGRKIPYLQKATIFKLMRNIGKTRSVAVYTNVMYKGSMYYMICEFEDNGQIAIYPFADFEEPILLNDGSNRFEDINYIIGLAVNPIIEQIKPFFSQSGLDIALFSSIEDDVVEVRDLKFQMIYNINKVIDINKIKGCVSSAFTIESSNITKGINMRFKRVGNFNKRDSQEAFIIEKIDQGFKFDEIVQQLLDNYDDLNDEMASDVIIKIRDELEVTRGTNRRRNLMIKINPGFQTVMNVNLITSELKITVSGINNIFYLNTIPVYIDSLVRITQDIKSTGISSSLINNLCSGKEIEDVEFGEITAKSEQSIEENEIPIIQNENPIYSDENNYELDDEEKEKREEQIDDLLDILGFDDDSDEENEIKGGNNSSREVSSDTTSTSTSTSKNSPKIVDSKDTGKYININTNNSNNQDITFDSPIILSDNISDIGSFDKSSKEIESSKLNEPIPVIEKEKEEEKEKEKEKEKKKEKEKEKEKEEKEEEIEIEVKPRSKINKKAPNTSLKKKLEENNKLLENTVKDITGMKLKYPNPFSSKLEANMPQLFIRNKGDKFDMYSRMCPFSLSERRQPVILTKEEKDEIIAQHPDPKDLNEEADFIEYGTDPNDSTKNLYYTCPRYWCMKTNTMVTKEDILDGKCGPKVNDVRDALIPKNAEVIPPGKTVYQFYDEKDQMYPGFHKKETPNGVCLPCCYSKWETPERKNRRDICQGKYKEDKAETVTEKEKVIEKELIRDVQELEYYVKGPEKYGPQLGEHRWGFLPIIVQKFLHEVNEDCQISKTNMNLKPNHTCILRHGVEVNINQSFIACIASAVFYAQKDELSNTKPKRPLINRFLPNAKNDVPSIKEMKELIIKSLNIDNFIKYQNGDLIESFADISIKIDLEKYKSSKLYKKVNLLKKSNTKRERERESESESERERESESVDENEQSRDIEFIIKVAQSFENFILFLRDDKIEIDYTYLWDLITMPNPKIFETGINLIILEIPENDVTNNIELVCPTNHYSVNSYDARKRSLILIKRENYFEPVYGYKTDGKHILITKTFSEYDRRLPKTLKTVFSKIIKPTLGEKCRAFISRPNEYRFKEPLMLDVLIDNLISRGYTILLQIMNFQGKVIGVLTKSKNELEGFVPCFPSSLTNIKNSKNRKTCDEPTSDGSTRDCDYDFVYMNDDVWKPYEETLSFLKEYYQYEEPENIKKANCYDPKYFCRVVEDGVLTGFLSNTNQFIPIKEPIPITTASDNIKMITNSDMLVADINTLTNNRVDSKRVDFIKRIQLETNFYNVFRNTIRILFNDYSNNTQRIKIQNEANKQYILYINQLETVIKLLHDLVKDNIIFASSEDGYNYKDIDEKDIHNCITIKNESCETKGLVCRITNDKCTLVLPKTNLVTNTDNETYYYGKMADELIRYNRIKSFIFKPQAYLSFSPVKYNLRENEIIVLQDLLNQDFFENLVPSEINKYAKYNTYDTAEPIITQTYTKEVNFDELINPKVVIKECIPNKPRPIVSIFWKKCFPSSYNEVDYKGNSICSLAIISYLLDKFKGIKKTTEDIKEDLIDIYAGLTENFMNKDNMDKIIDILREESQFDINLLQNNSITFEQMIIQDGFVAINFDLWLLLVHYKIPSIFISTKPIPETRYNFKEFVCYKDESETTKTFAFIITPAMYRRELTKFPEYKLIINSSNDSHINISELQDGECKESIETAIEHYISIQDYIYVFEKDKTTKYKPKKKGIRAIEFDIIEESPNPNEDMNYDKVENIDINTEKIKKTKIRKIRKIRKIKNTLVLEEEEQPIIQDENVEMKNIKDIIENNDNLQFEIEPLKRKTRKQREKKVSVNPSGKKGTRNKKQPLVFDIVEDNV